MTTEPRGEFTPHHHPPASPPAREFTTSDIDALIRRAELTRGRAVGQRELLMRTLFNVALAFIDLEAIRLRMMNNKISVVFRSAQDGSLQAKAEITVPTE